MSARNSHTQWRHASTHWWQWYILVTATERYMVVCVWSKSILLPPRRHVNSHRCWSKISLAVTMSVEIYTRMTFKVPYAYLLFSTSYCSESFTADTHCWKNCCKANHITKTVLQWAPNCLSLYTLSNKNPSAWNFLSPEPEVTCGTVAIIIRVVLLSPYLRIRGVSLSSIHYNQSHRVYINRRQQYICLIWN